MDPVVMGAFFMHPDQGLFLAKEYVLVCIIMSCIYLPENCVLPCCLVMQLSKKFISVAFDC
jgi:hypothetical protein